MNRRFAWLAAILAIAAGCHHAAPLPSAEQVIESKADLWGNAALHQQGGPSYAFFQRLLPPLRYVDADFHVYPIVLSAPGSKTKGRLVSDGSAINALARQPNWKNEQGMPVHILIGATRAPFMSTTPQYADGYLPIVQLHDGEYAEEIFASVDPQLATAGALPLNFTFPAVDRGRIELRFESGYEQLTGMDGVVRDASGKALAAFDDNWEFSPFRSALVSKAAHAKSASVLIFTTPAEWSTPPIDLAFYQKQRANCIQCWNSVLSNGMNVQVPEPIVNNAWRSLMIQTQMIRWGDQLNYSASNQYARQYANESGDTMRSMLLWGQTETARRSIEPIFVYRRPGIQLHDAAFKLELLADYYFVTRDEALIQSLKPLWQREIDLILSSRDPSTGLLPKEAYCSDIRTPVRSLNTNANCWRGLRDMALVLDETDDREQATKLSAIAAEYRKIILAAMEKSIVRSVDPPWVPVALDGEEPPANPITSTRMGSYWNLVVPCVLGSGIFPIDSPPADAIIHTIQQNGGLCMGMTRVQSARAGGWINVQNIDDLYVIRYVLALLKRDEPDRALVSFYGKLAQGMTRDTFIDGESTSIEPLDDHGRQMALPPNSTANASFLLQLRYLLVQDWDTDEDGRADALHLAFATPRAWLAPGKRIVVERAPTAFGPVSFQINATTDRIDVQLDLPPRSSAITRLRLRLPDARHIASVSLGTLERDRETIDLTGLSGHVSLTATVAK